MVEKLNKEEYQKQLKEENERKRTEGSNGESTGESNPDTTGHFGDSTGEDGHGFLSLSGQSLGVEGQLGHISDGDRKSESSSGRVSSPQSTTGSVDRRPSKDSSKGRPDGTNISTGTRSPAKVVRQEGNLIATEEIPPRDFFPNKEKVITELPPKIDSTPEGSAQVGGVKGTESKSKTSGSVKQTDKRAVQEKAKRESADAKSFQESKSFTEKIEKVHWLDKGRTLTKAEAQELKEPLVNALRDDFGYLDQYLLHVTKTNEPIWSDADDEEIELCVRILLKQGMKNAAAAEVARAAAEGSDYLSFMMFSIPRLHKTWMAMQNRPRKTKKRNEKEPVRTNI